MVRWTLTVLVYVSVVILVAAGSLVQGQTPSKAVQTSRIAVYEIEITTTLVIPVGNDKIDQVKVFHALPTLRAWSPAKALRGATKVTFSPATGKELSEKPAESRHLLWVIDGVQKPGAKHTCRSTMTVASPDRTLNLKAVSTAWKDYDVPSADKAAVVDPAVVKTLHPELAKVAAKLKAELPPARAVQAMCKYIVDNYKYDASVIFKTSDIQSIVLAKRGHCGHQATLLRQLTAAAGVPNRTVYGITPGPTHLNHHISPQ